MDEEELLLDQVADEQDETPEEITDDTGEEEQQEDDGVLTIDLGGDDAEVEPEDEREGFRNMRNRIRELTEENRRLKAPEKQEDALGPKPTPEDFDYDYEKLEAALLEWHDRKRKADARKAEEEEAQRKLEESWQERLKQYDTGKAAIKNFSEVEAVALDILDKPLTGLDAPDVRLNIIKQGVDDAHMIVYALGQNPTRARKLAEIDDPVKFAIAIGELKATMKVNRNKPAPERVIKGPTGGGNSLTPALEKAWAEGQKTGDFSKYQALKRRKG